MTMQTTLTMINVHISSTAPNVVINELTPQLQALQKMVADLQHNPAFSADTGSERLNRSHARLRESAKAVASHATVIMGSRSTTWAGSEPDLSSFQSELEGPARGSKRSETTGSELGEPLAPEDRYRISSWMRKETFAPLDTLDEAESVQEPVPKSNESRATVDTFSSGTATLAADEFGSDDEDLELEMAQKYLAMGRQRFADGKYAQAESTLRKALTKFHQLGKKAGEVNHQDIGLDIARACFLQDKIDKAQDLCDAIVRDPPGTDADRARMLEASHLLAQIHLRNGALDNAMRQCKQTLTARRRLDGKSKGYHDSVALMIVICECRDDEDDAMMFDSLLPEGFEKLEYRRPDQSAISANLPPATPPVLASLPTAPKSPPPVPPRLTQAALHAANAANAPAAPPPVPVVKPPIPVLDDSLLDSTSGLSSEVQNPLHRSISAATVRSKPPPPTPPLAVSGGAGLQPDRIPRVPSYNTLHSGVSQPTHIRTDSEPATIASADSVGETDFSSPRSPSEVPNDISAYLSSGGMRLRRSQPDSPEATPARRPEPAKAKPPRKPIVPLASRSVSEPVPERSVTMPTIPKLEPVPRTLYAIEEDDAIRTLTKHDRDPSSKYFDTQEALLWASEYGQDLVVRLMLQGFAQQVKKRTLGFSSKDTVFRNAVYVDTMDDAKRTPLHLAAIFGHEMATQILLERGASTTKRQACTVEGCSDPDCKAGSTAFEWAVIYSHLKVVKVFLAKKADLTTRDFKEYTLLHYAAMYGNRDITQLLLGAGMNPRDVTSTGKCALHIAAENGRDNLIELLLQHGTSVELLDHENNTPLQLAVASGHSDCADKLLKNGADVLNRDSAKLTPLHDAASRGHAHLFGLLMEAGADTEARDETGWTPLLHAVRQNHKGFAKKLLNEGANARVRDNTGHTALHIAAEWGT